MNKKYIITRLKMCEPRQVNSFMRMFSPDDLNANIDTVVGSLSPKEISMAFKQVTRALEASKLPKPEPVAETEEPTIEERILPDAVDKKTNDTSGVLKMAKYLIKSNVSDLRVGIKNERLFFYSVGTKNGSWGACTLETDAGRIIAEKQYQHPLNVFDNNGLVDWNCKNFSFSAPIMGTSPFKTAKTRLLLYFFNSHNLNERIVTKQKQALKTWLKEELPSLSCINSLMDSLKYDIYGEITKAYIIKELRAYAASQKKIVDAILGTDTNTQEDSGVMNADAAGKKTNDAPCELKITGFKELNEPTRRAMQIAHDACKLSGVKVPKEVASFLENISCKFSPVNIGEAVYSSADTNRRRIYHIKLAKLPSGIKHIEVIQS